jgi:glycosyltransferase involved in cell wall biosynthesis
MKVLMITTTYPRFKEDTAAPFIASIAEGIAALGHSVDVITPFHPRLEEGLRSGVRVHSYHVPGDTKDPLWGYAQSLDSDVKLRKRAIAIAPLALHQTFWRALKIAKEVKADLIHAHWVLPNGFPAALISKKLKLPLVISLHGSDMFLARKNFLFRRVAASIFKKAAAITACSPDLQTQAATISGADVRVLEYGVDVDHFSPQSDHNRKKHSILSVGRLVHKKGFDQLLEAFAGIRPYYNDSILTIAGAGPLLSQLRGKCDTLGITSAVHFPGNVDRKDLPRYYATAELVVVPSITDEFGNRDGLPNVFLEGLSSGCAVIASDIPGIRNVVRNEDVAVLISSGDVDLLRKALMELLQHPEQQQSLRVEARRKALKELSWKVKSKELESLYQSLVYA